MYYFNFIYFHKRTLLSCGMRIVVPYLFAINEDIDDIIRWCWYWYILIFGQNILYSVHDCYCYNGCYGICISYHPDKSINFRRVFLELTVSKEWTT